MRRGFTLIELLVVIAIIAILAAILFPVFARAREKAKSSSCLSNVKQITLGIIMYVQDYDETLPLAGPGRWMAPGDYAGCCGGNALMWYTEVTPYVKNQGIFRCPSVKGDVAYATSCRDMGYLISEFKSPATTCLVTDSYGTKAWGTSAMVQQPTDAPWGGPAGCGGGLYNCVDSDRHNGGVNVGYADGHAKWNKVQVFSGDRALIPASKWDP